MNSKPNYKEKNVVEAQKVGYHVFHVDSYYYERTYMHASKSSYATTSYIATQFVL